MKYTASELSKKFGIQKAGIKHYLKNLGAPYEEYFIPYSRGMRLTKVYDVSSFVLKEMEYRISVSRRKRC